MFVQGADFRGLFLVERRVNRGGMHESSGIRGEGKQSGEEEDRGRKGNALRKGGGGGEGGGRLHEDNPEVCVCMCSVWPTIDTLLINHDETLWAVSVHARPPVVSSALLLSSSATVNDDHLPIHFYSLLSLSLDYYFANHPKCPFLSLLLFDRYPFKRCL